MPEKDLILNPGYPPAYDQIFDYANKTAQALWQDLNSFIQQKHKASPKIMYSKCSAKPGWNVKYNKSGKSKILELIRSSRPFNGTLWLMIQVNRSSVVDNIKELLLLKHRKADVRKG